MTQLVNHAPPLTTSVWYGRFRISKKSPSEIIEPADLKTKQHNAPAVKLDERENCVGAVSSSATVPLPYIYCLRGRSAISTYPLLPTTWLATATLWQEKHILPYPSPTLALP
eukprot:5713721-Pyramimonas_sp.AAC.1